jgi:hypothetical protein
MSFYTSFDCFKMLRLFVNERNLKIDVVLKASRAVVIRWFSEIISIRLYTPCNTRSEIRKGVYNLIEVISNEPNK